MTRTIAIVGAGLSGTLTAVHLLQRACADDLRILLFNRSGWLARGLAYGTRSDAHVLNVPAARMSAFGDDPGHFLRFAQRRDPALGEGSFVRRQVYGDYLEWIVREAHARLADRWRFEQVIGHVDRIDLAKDGAWLRIGIAEPYRADRVVLALGNFAPADPALSDSADFLAHTPRYVRDPWAAGALDAVDTRLPALLIGTGLTMVDVALALQARAPLAPLHALSRHGLLPQPHRSEPAPPAGATLPPALLEGTPRPRDCLRALRERCEQDAAQGIDWRETLAALRQATPGLWQRLDVRGRAQFLRHLQAYWDVHRHRLAPESARRVNALRAQGALRVHAGRLLSLQDCPAGVLAAFRPRGATAAASLQVGSVVNCTGPATRLAALREPLLQSLQAAGALVPDPLGLGVSVDQDLALLDASGRASTRLQYIGPFLRARYWECTAVPELRAHARALAGRLCATG